MAEETTKILEIKVDTSMAIKEIVEYRKKIEELKEAEKSLSEQYKKKEIDEQTYRVEMEKTKIKTREYTNIIRVLSKEVNNNIKVDRNKVGSLKGLRAELSNLTKQYDELSREERENAQGKEILDKINKVTIELKEAEMATQRYYRNVGNYASAWNGLGISIQQVARELPSLTMGFNTFFLAISNNLPILVDELTRARKEYAALIKEGKAATPVWKQVVSSIFSWQTAMVAGITILSMYGKEIMNWVGSLFSANKAIGESVTEFEDFRKAVGESSGEQIASIHKLSAEWVSLGSNMNEQKKFIEANKDEFQKLGVNITSVLDAENALVTNKDKFIESVILRAKAAAAMDMAAEEYKKGIQKMMEADAMADTITTTINVGNQYQANWISDTRENEKKKKAKAEAAAIMEQGNAMIKQATEFSNEAGKIIDSAGIKGAENAKKIAKATIDTAKIEIDAVRAMEDAIIQLIKDSNDKKRRELEVSYEREIEDLKKRLEKEKNLTENARAAITATITAKEEAKRNALLEFDKKLSEDEFKAEYERQLKLAQVRLAAQESNSVEELELKKSILKMQYEEELRLYADNEEMKLALKEKYNADNAALDKAFNDHKKEEEQKLADEEVAIQQEKLRAMSDVTGSLVDLIEAVGESNKAAAVASKILALAQIAIDTGAAISSGIAQAAKAGPFPANLAAIATTVATVIANMATALKYIKGAKFATGGDVTGAGTGTSDSIPAMLSNGESVMTARATSMFAPILSAFNQAGGGVPIHGQQTGNQAMGEDMLAKAFAKGVANMPNPVVSVEEINTVSKRVEAIENLNKI